MWSSRRLVLLLALLLALVSNTYWSSGALATDPQHTHTITEPAPKVTVVEPAPNITVVDRGVKDDDGGGGFWQNLLFTAIGGVAVGGTAEVSRRRSKKDARRVNEQREIDAIDDLLTAIASIAPMMVPFAKSAPNAATEQSNVLSLTSAIAGARAAVTRVDDEELHRLADDVLDNARRVIDLRSNPAAAQKQILVVGGAIDRLESRANGLRAALRAAIKKAA